MPGKSPDPKFEKPPNRFFDIHPPVFWPAVILAFSFIAITLVVGAPMKAVFSAIQEWVSNSFGWFFIVSVNLFLIFTLYLSFSKYGSIRLGGKNAVPEFSRMSWFAMLFSAGMGIGILFWSVAEPVFHFTAPPLGDGGTVEAAKQAMNTTFLHWGLHAWGIYALVGLALAFFSFNHRLPLAIRSVFHPLLGEKVHGKWGDLIDILAVLATLFGLATSLGFGVQQVNAGLNHLFGMTVSTNMQVLLIAVITFAVSISVASGLEGGVKKLSELNMKLGGMLLAFMLVFGPTLFILDAFLQNTGAYLDNFLEISFWTEAYEQTDWQNSWTVFYWSWWISWSPFVGMFIARISKGRTIREFVLSVLIIPTLLTFLWITAFGGSAILLELKGIADMAGPVSENVAISIYVLLEQFPFSTLANLAAILLVVSFFITSSDSGSLVVDTFTSGGKLVSPVTQRIFWAVVQGVMAGVLLIGGGLTALQTAAIITGLPFAAILLIMGYSLKQGLEKEYEKEQLREKEIERESYQDTIKKLLQRRNQ